MFCPVPEEKWVLLAVFHHRCLKAKDECSEGCKIKHPNQPLLVHQGNCTRGKMIMEEPWISIWHSIQVFLREEWSHAGVSAQEMSA